MLRLFRPYILNRLAPSKPDPYSRGAGIIALQHIEHTPQRLPIEPGTDAHTVFAGNIDLDPLRESRCATTPTIVRVDGSRAEPGSRYWFRQLNTWFAFTAYGRQPSRPAELRMVQLAEGAADDQSAKARSRARIGSYTAFCKGPARLEPTSARPVDVSIISIGSSADLCPP